VGQQGTLSYVWAPIGSRPARVRDCRHESAYLFGAICPAHAVGAAIVMPWVSSEAMTLHLAEISKQVGSSAHALLVCDSAGWHQPGTRLTVPDNITLLRLPPYAPELNPMGRWCTWRLEVEIAPNPRLLCNDRLTTDGNRAPGRQHPVQHRHADGSLGLLGGEAAGSQTRSDQRLVATHCRFY